MATIDYTSRLHCTAADGKLALTGEIFDDKQNKFQKQINQEVKTRLDNLGDEIGQKISGVYRPKGSLDFARVMALTPAVGDVYDIPAEFTLNGHKYPAYTNIVATKAAPGENSWDTLGGTVDVQDILSKAATATDSKLQPVSQKATAAEATANAAKKAAETALTTATSASETASSAKTTADTATQTANAASETALSAKATADTATQTANTAKETANTAQSEAFAADKKASHIQGKLIKFSRVVSTKQQTLMASLISGGEIVYLSGQGDTILGGNGFYFYKDGKYYNNRAGDEAIAGKTPNTFAQDSAGNLYIGVDGNRLEKIEVLNEVKTALSALAQRVTALENLLKLA